jgi:hypothetical protein
MSRLLAAGAVLFIACGGCVTGQKIALDPAAAKIKLVHEHDKPLRCKAVADVRSEARGASDETAKESAGNAIRNAAAKYKNINYVQLDKEQVSPVGTTDAREAFFTGKALICTEDETATP